MNQYSFSSWPGHPTFDTWMWIDDVIGEHMHSTSEWKIGGYTACSPMTEKKFGIKITRRSDMFVVYTFISEEDFLTFKIKYGDKVKNR